jgi:hypothetical protein
MTRRPRRVPTRAELARRITIAHGKLAADQLRDLAIVHLEQFDALQKGEGTVEILWDMADRALLWSRVADQLGTGQEEMRAQLDLVVDLIARWLRTGRVAFDGPGLQLAREGIGYMADLAECTSRRIAVEACDWAQARVARIKANPQAATLN